MDLITEMLSRAVSNARTIHKDKASAIGLFTAVILVRSFYRPQRGFSSNTTSDTYNENTNLRKKSILYTRTGDKGTSSLYTGERRSKTDPVFEALGHQDELCAAIGIAREHCHTNDNGLNSQLVEIQSRLFDLGAAVATPQNNSNADKIAYTLFDSRHTSKLEEWIDHLDSQLPPLTTFIVPSGGLSSTHLHLARVICRRAERAVVPLVDEEEVDSEVGRYLNRLSDYLFCAARTAAFREGHEEIEWRKAK
jgi:cob(I)alamin adenosyltransferase